MISDIFGFFIEFHAVLSKFHAVLSKLSRNIPQKCAEIWFRRAASGACRQWLSPGTTQASKHHKNQPHGLHYIHVADSYNNSNFLWGKGELLNYYLSFVIQDKCDHFNWLIANCFNTMSFTRTSKCYISSCYCSDGTIIIIFSSSAKYIICF